MRLFALSALLIFSFISCQKEMLQDVDTDSIIGKWVNPVYKDSTICYEKTIWKNTNSYSITFKAEGNLVEHKNSGWCGTPPVSYGDFEGTWNLTDSIISINVQFWGGYVDYQWKVLTLDNSKLEVMVLNQSYKFIAK